jgi:hypothetical protein
MDAVGGPAHRYCCDSTYNLQRVPSNHPWQRGHGKVRASHTERGQVTITDVLYFG